MKRGDLNRTFHLGRRGNAKASHVQVETGEKLGRSFSEFPVSVMRAKPFTVIRYDVGGALTQTSRNSQLLSFSASLGILLSRLRSVSGSNQ